MRGWLILGTIILPVILVGAKAGEQSMGFTVMDKVVIITGSTGGIGEGIARQLAAHGARVIVSGRRAQEGHRVINAINHSGGEAIFCQADVTHVEDCERLIDTAVNHYGCVDALINNAAIFPQTAFENVTPDEWDKVFAVNVRAAFILSQQVIPHLQRRGGGTIVNIGSTLAYRGTLNRIAYATSKGALLTLTKILARELLSDRIRVNWVTVGWVATPGEIELRNQVGQNGQIFLNEAAHRAPLGRLETVEETATSVVYLISEEASHITGCELNISGGLWI
jgi:NAD(P)-dependent dehydrogenase (short-subunit alcohol dehydrogenase family)